MHLFLIQINRKQQQIKITIIIIIIKHINITDIHLQKKIYNYYLSISIDIAYEGRSCPIMK